MRVDRRERVGVKAQRDIRHAARTTVAIRHDRAFPRERAITRAATVSRRRVIVRVRRAEVVTDLVHDHHRFPISMVVIHERIGKTVANARGKCIRPLWHRACHTNPRDASTETATVEVMPNVARNRTHVCLPVIAILVELRAHFGLRPWILTSPQSQVGEW